MSSPAPTNSPSTPAKTEEDVKNNIILPWLRRMGINESETSFEASFTIRLGHNQVVVNSDKKKSSIVGGRLDTLVKRNGRNLLIVEFKASGLSLTDADRDQAVSYARILDQIAPYALVTNGSDFALYDVLTKQSCSSIALNGGYTVSLPADLIAEAQAFFLGLSLDNLMAFCDSQIRSQIKPLEGSETQLDRKYVPSLVVPRLVLDDWLVNLHRTALPGLLMLAESGRGKTSALCDMAIRRLVQHKPTLFFAAGSFEGNLLNAIADSFNWVFTEQPTPTHLVKRLDTLTATKGGLLIIIDAVDEWLSETAAPSLLNFLRGISGSSVKVLFSCKTNAWRSFSAPRGNLLGFEAFLVPSAVTGERAHHLPALSDTEFHKAVARYRTAFNVRGRIETATLSEARRDPFLLRVLFSVAAVSGVDNISFSLRDFFASYYDALLRRTGNQDVADAQLVGIARALAEQNRASLSIDEIRSALSIPATASLIPALFEQDILIRTSAGVAFTFQYLRDFLIAFRVRNYHVIAPTAFPLAVAQGVAREAFSFYLRFASPEQMRALCGVAYSNAEAYLALYDSILARYFPRLRIEFSPQEKGLVGFIAEYVANSPMIGSYGFRIRQVDDPPVLFVPVESVFSKSNLLAVSGADELFYSSSSNGFVGIDVPREVVNNEIARQMKDILRDQRLLMKTTTAIPVEAAIAAIERMSSVFASFYDADFRKIQYPISTSSLRLYFTRLKLAEHFRSEVEAEKAAAAGSRASLPLTDQDRKEVIRRVDEAISSARQIRHRSISVNLRNLEQYFERLGVFDIPGQIPGELWPNDYALSETLLRDPKEGQSQMEALVVKLFRAFLDDYRVVIDENFPTLGSSFSLYANLPALFYLDVRPTVDGHFINGWVSLIAKKLPDGHDSQFVVCQPGELDRYSGTYRGEIIPAPFLNRSERLDQFIAWKKGATPLYDLLYRWVTHEWPAVVTRIRTECVPSE